MGSRERRRQVFQGFGKPEKEQKFFEGGGTNGTILCKIGYLTTSIF